MAHIADLYNNGRCGQLRTIDQARGAYAELIQKEIRSGEVSHIRRVMQLMKVTCPACGTLVTSVKCHVCNYFPIPLPNNSEVEAIEEEQRRRKGLPSVARTRDSSIPQQRPPAEEGNRNPPSRTGSRDPREAQQRLEHLQQLVEEERAQQRKMLGQIGVIKELLDAAVKAEDDQSTMMIPKSLPKVSKSKKIAHKQ